jgi:signal transduction histidine kinase
MKLRAAVYITLFVLAVCLAITLIVLWNIYIIRDYLTIRDLHAELHGSAADFSSNGRWAVLALGITAGVVLIVALSLFFAAVMRGHLLKRQQRDFSNMMTHELRLPLSAIRLLAQTLRTRAGDPEERDRFADGILAECERLGLLVDQLLKIQQMEHGQLMLHKRVLDASELARDFVAKWPRPLRLSAPATPPGLRVEADPLLLEMSLTNLVTNAEKYGRGSTPELRVTRERGLARFAVRDGGRPMDRKYVKKVFRKFYRVPNLATRRQSGVGLGLYIVRQVARLHKGDARALPMREPGAEGNEFSFTVPLSPAPAGTRS